MKTTEDTGHEAWIRSIYEKLDDKKKPVEKPDVNSGEVRQ